MEFHAVRLVRDLAEAANIPPNLLIPNVDQQKVDEIFKENLPVLQILSVDCGSSDLSPRMLEDEPLIIDRAGFKPLTILLRTSFFDKNHNVTLYFF